MINIFAIWKSDHFISATKEIFSERNIHIVGICTNPENAVEDFCKCNPRPDIVLLDAHWKNCIIPPGIALRKFFSIEPVKIILTTTFFKEHDLKEFESMGVKGSFNRTQGIDEIVKCINNVYNDKFSFADRDKII